MSQIDFQKITQTIQGLKCQYIGERVNWTGVHVFAVYNGTSEVFCYYDNQGSRVEFCGSKGAWLVVDNLSAHQIVKPRQKVEVTRWLTYHHNSGGGISVRMHGDNPEGKELTAYAGKTVKVTEVF